MDIGERFSGIAVTDQKRRSDMRMCGKKAQEFPANIAACTKNQGVDHSGQIGYLHNYAILYA